MAGIVLTALPGRWSLPALGLCLAGALGPGALAEWRRTRFASRVHGLWLASAGAAILLALARDHQGRRTTLLFGSPSNLSLAVGGAVLCVALRAVGRKAGARASTMLPVVFLAVSEGGDPSIAIGNGFFAAWLLWDVVERARAGAAGQAARAIGALAQGALLALYLVPPRDLAWLRLAPVATAVGAAAALSALWFIGPRVTARMRRLTLLALPALVAGIELLHRSALGEAAVELGLALLLASVVGLAVHDFWRGNSPAAKWATVCALVALWWLLSTPPQRLVIGLAVGGLVAFVRTAGPARPAVAVALAGLALAFWRWGLVGHFEGEFGFGSLEISLAYVGNPGRHAPQGALTIILKAWLPLAVAAAVLRNEALDEKAGDLARPLLAAAAFAVGARIVHLALATAANPDSFYTMHRILGELTHQIVILIGIGLTPLGRAPRRAAEVAPLAEWTAGAA